MATAAVIYARQSLDKQGDGLGVARQEAECRRLCEQRGWTVQEVIVDNDRSATTGVRPGYQRLLSLMENRQVQVVVVLRIDRLLRRMTELEAFIELSERAAVPVATVEGDVDLSTPSGRLVGRLLASVARAEVEVKSERHKLANRQKAAAGKPHGSRRPYGYEKDLVTIHEPEAAVLREMARRIMAGHSYKEVAWWANREGHATTLGKSWYPITVRNLLQKKRYGGIREYQGAEYKAVWQPIFDAETWQRLQLTIKLRAEGPDTPVARKYLLTGLLFCGACGQPLNGSTKQDHRGRPVRRVYHCRVHGDTRREGGCGGVTRNAAALDDWIKRCVFYRLDSAALGKLLSDGSADDSQLSTLLTDRQAQQLRLDSLVDDYATGLLNREQFARAKAGAEAELGRIEHEIERLNRGRSAAGLLPVGQTVKQAWDESESDAWRRGLLGLLIKRIDVRPGITKPFYHLSDGTRARFDPDLIDITWLV